MSAPSTRGAGGDPRKRQKGTEQPREGEKRGGSSWKDREGREGERGGEQLRASAAGLWSGFVIYRILIAGNRLQLETL